MIRPDHHAQDMRDDDADEADAAADGNGSADGCGDADDGDIFQPLYGDAHMKGCRLAERQRIQAARHEGKGQQRKHDDRAGAGNLAPGRAGQRSHAPEGQVAQLPVVGHIDENTGCRQGERAERDAGKQHRCDRCLSVSRRNPIEQNRCYQAADESGDGQRKDAEDVRDWGEYAAAEHDHGDRTEAGAGGNADQAGIGQRVAKQTLHDGARNRKPTADQEAENGAGQADVEDDDAVANAERVFCPAAQHAGDHVDDRRVRGACGDRDGNGSCRNQDEADDDEDRKCGAIPFATARRGLRHLLQPCHGIVECHVSLRRWRRSARGSHWRYAVRSRAGAGHPCV
ncbi:hypothetical protein RHSP_80496 [Rhizobium freirei PRF 81]|uniref:Uncharacterized protein n=1 Tax=Rhizobium freirei PRF 81 TaxID=363754 RepID=N6UBD7_9HYPH|nr:hypothetical protein RHSP_80496 [Rhizobium freirei PRF 81]